MIISRRKYEQAINEAREEGSRKAEERFWQERQFTGIYDRIRGLEDTLRKMEGPHECSCGNAENLKCATNPFRG